MTELMWSITVGLFSGMFCYFPLHYILKDEALKMPFPMAIICWFYGNFIITFMFGVIGHILGYGIIKLLDIENKSADELINIKSGKKLKEGIQTNFEKELEDRDFTN